MLHLQTVFVTNASQSATGECTLDEPMPVWLRRYSASWLATWRWSLSRLVSCPSSDINTMHADIISTDWKFSMAKRWAARHAFTILQTTISDITNIYVCSELVHNICPVAVTSQTGLVLQLKIQISMGKIAIKRTSHNATRWSERCYWNCPWQFGTAQVTYFLTYLILWAKNWHWRHTGHRWCCSL